MPLSIPIDYRAFYKESPAALFECKADDNWTIVNANNTFYDLIGYTEETFAQTMENSFLSLLKKESRTSLASDFDAYMKAYSKNHQAPYMLSKLLLRRHDHSFINILVSAKIIEDGHERIACVFIPSFEEHVPVIVEAEKPSKDVVKEELARKKADKDSQAIKFAGKRLLFAEDHPLNVQMLSKMLTGIGFEVSSANNGQKAMETFEQYPADYFFAVLVDTQMPIMDGVTVAEKIRVLENERGSKSKVPIIAMAATSEDIAKSDKLPECFDDILIKPVGVSKLLDVLITFIEE